MGVASGSGWNLWVWLLDVVVRRYIDFLILLIPTPLVSVLFYSIIPTFCSFLKCFSFFNNIGWVYCLRLETQFVSKVTNHYLCYQNHPHYVH